jgi:L-fuconolactonase
LLTELAQRENVTCKLSGMLTEADWAGWSLDSLRPYLDAAVEAFGPERLMAGSDWPVCLVASGYTHWWQTLRTYFAGFSEAERERIFGGTAVEVYRLG